MQKKYMIALFGIGTGLMGAASVRQLPGYASQIQMVLYTVIVLGLLIIGFWSDLGRQKFWKGICLVALLHLAILISIRSLFPFKTILVVIPIAVTEGIIAATLFLKMVGY
jgi:hypothetical protein